MSDDLRRTSGKLGIGCKADARREQYRAKNVHDAQRLYGADESVRCGRRHRGAAQVAVLAGVPGDDIRPVWGLFGGRYGLRIAMADDGERITRNRSAGNRRRDAQQNGMQGNRVDRRPTHCPSETNAHNVQCFVAKVERRLNPLENSIMPDAATSPRLSDGVEIEGNVRFGSLADKSSPTKIRLCPKADVDHWLFKTRRGTVPRRTILARGQRCRRGSS